MKRICFPLIVSLFIINGCDSGTNLRENSNIEQQTNTTTSSQSSFPFDSMLKFNNTVYVGTKEEIQDIGEQIGEVEVYSTNETDNREGTSSTKYQKGTKLFSVKGEKVENVIAVQLDSNTYIKAYSYEYKYKNP